MCTDRITNAAKNMAFGSRLNATLSSDSESMTVDTLRFSDARQSLCCSVLNSTFNMFSLAQG